MSLLPEQIIPQTTPIGRVTPDGDVLIDKDWWLLFYNLCAQVLGIGNAGSLPDSAAQALASAEADIVDADSVTLRSPIANLLARIMAGPELPDAVNPQMTSPTQAMAFADDPPPIGALPETNGGTAQTQYVLGDILYSFGANRLARLPGNTSSTRNFLTQTGTGSASAAPSWGTIGAADLPGSFNGFANPSAKVGTTAVNGSAATAMRSDAAPSIDQSITPTWTGLHTFNASVTIGAPVSGYSLTVNSTNSQIATLSSSGANNGPQLYFVGNNGKAYIGVDAFTSGTFSIGSTGGAPLPLNLVVAGSPVLAISTGGETTLSGELAINGGTPTAQLTGFGSPSGSVSANLSGTSTLAEVAGTLAALLSYLKSIGFVGA